jgi:hypothetical protein
MEESEPSEIRPNVHAVPPDEGPSRAKKTARRESLRLEDPGAVQHDDSFAGFLVVPNEQALPPRGIHSVFARRGVPAGPRSRQTASAGQAISRRATRVSVLIACVLALMTSGALLASGTFQAFRRGEAVSSPTPQDESGRASSSGTTSGDIVLDERTAATTPPPEPAEASPPSSPATETSPPPEQAPVDEALLPATADSYCASGATPSFQGPLVALKERLGDGMGSPAECAHLDPETGDTVQVTTTGLAFIRMLRAKDGASAVPFFTNGWEHWALTRRGLAYWTGDAVDPPRSAALLTRHSGPARTR